MSSILHISLNSKVLKPWNKIFEFSKKINYETQLLVGFVILLQSKIFLK